MISSPGGCGEPLVGWSNRVWNGCLGYLFRDPKFLVIPVQTALMPQAKRVTYP